MVRWRGKPPADGAVEGEMPPSVCVFENHGAVEGKPAAAGAVEGEKSC